MSKKSAAVSFVAPSARSPKINEPIKVLVIVTKRRILPYMRSGLILRATLMAAAIFFAFMPSASQADVSPTKPSVDAAFGDKIARAAAEGSFIWTSLSEPYPWPEYSVSKLRGLVPVDPGKQALRSLRIATVSFPAFRSATTKYKGDGVVSSLSWQR